MHLRRTAFYFSLLLIATSAFAQQTGSISGKVMATDGSALPGVTVEARSNVLPQPRVTETDLNGDYRLPALIPGSYNVTFTLSGMQTVTRKAQVILSQNTPVDVKLGMQGLTESITVTAASTLVDKTTPALQSGLSEQQIQALPITQDYRDVTKLIPAVMYTQDAVRGPSAGASGQENVYLFDGANVTMPLFGVLVAEPNTHDIAQVSVLRGGAQAVDFYRAGGFQIDSVSKTGTNKFTGEVGYQVLKHGFVADQKTGQASATYQQDRNWTTVNVGGPVLQDRLFFYGSYYRPEFTRGNQSNLYGSLPGYSKNRNEGFGKLTFTPTESWLFNGSYRRSHTVETSGAFLNTQAPTTGSGSETTLKLATLEGSKVINSKSYATFKVTDFRNPGGGRADIFSPAEISTAIGTHLDIANLATQGRITVPTLLPGNAAQNTFVQPFINQFGYRCPDNPAAQGLTCVAGALTGGGTVGFGQYTANNDSFFRKSAQAGYNITLGTNVSHDLHVGYQRHNDSEDLFRTSNGWGLIQVPGPTGTCPANACGTAKPAFFIATVAQQGSGLAPIVHSEFHSQNVELNDVIHWNNWSFNAGVLASQDVLYGQGLKRADNVAGFTTSPGTKYRMHTWSWSDEMQPRLGATWAYNGRDTVYASLGRFIPEANSDARAASWDRNLTADISAYFDQSGNLLGVAPVAGSSGKWWQEGIKPAEYKEAMLGTARQLTNAWSARLYARARKGDHYIEDTNNNARSLFKPPAGTPTADYVPNLCNNSQATTCGPNTIRGAIGSGSTYVIANLDGAFTKYLEATAETEWRGSKASVHGSYTWSHFYGNFDQDYSTVNNLNDMASFIGSSFLGDAAGRQLWNNKYGDLRGDRRHLLKLYGTYYLPWNASTGAFFVYQSGQPYQLESVLAYRDLTTSSNASADTSRYAEPAGSRRTPSQTDLDFNYTQNFKLIRGLNLQLAFDMFNVMNRQTGYSYEERVGGIGNGLGLGFTTRTDIATVAIPSSIPASVLAGLGVPANARVVAPFPLSFLAPRRFQIAARLQF